MATENLNSSNKIDLREGDLVLMSFVGDGETGPAFEMIDRIGALDILNEAEGSAPQDCTSEHDGEGRPSLRTPDQPGLPGGMTSQSLLGKLEEQRDALDDVIRQLKGRQSGTGEVQPTGAGRKISSPDTKASDNSSFRAQPRELSRGRDRSPARH